MPIRAHAHGARRAAVRGRAAVLATHAQLLRTPVSHAEAADPRHLQQPQVEELLGLLGAGVDPEGGGQESGRVSQLGGGCRTWTAVAGERDGVQLGGGCRTWMAVGGRGTDCAQLGAGCTATHPASCPPPPPSGTWAASSAADEAAPRILKQACIRRAYRWWKPGAPNVAASCSTAVGSHW
jgi:hypothetical protein